MKTTVILNETNEEEYFILNGAHIPLTNTTLQQFRENLKKHNGTEINTIYRAGKYVVTFITDKLNRIQLVDCGLIKGTREERKELKKIRSLSPKEQVQKIGYCWN